MNSGARPDPAGMGDHRIDAGLAGDPALVVEFGEEGGQRRVPERLAGESDVEAAGRPGVRPTGVRADGGLRRGGPGRCRELELSRWG